MPELPFLGCLSFYFQWVGLKKIFCQSSVPPPWHLLSGSSYSLTAITMQQSAETDKALFSAHTHPARSPSMFNDSLSVCCWRLFS